MKNIRSFFGLVATVLLISSPSHAQWAKAYGVNDCEYAVEAKQRADGGVIIGGG